MYTIEFLGLSRAGKTSQIKLLEDVLNTKSTRYACFRRPHISLEKMGTVEKFHETMLEKMCEIYNSSTSKNLDFLIYDRGFYDRIALLNIDLRTNAISETFYNNFLPKLYANTEKIDRTFIFFINPEGSLNRWPAQKKEMLDTTRLNKGLQTCDDLAGLKLLNKIYLDLLKEIKCENCIIDGQIDKVKTHQQIIQLLKL